MANRIMGAAIRDLPSPSSVVLDVGCGACRVAHMVRDAGKGRVVGVDISLESLRSAAQHNPDPVVNADNQQLPIRSDIADLVISNGVIMVTPDAHRSFDEPVRITKPGGDARRIGLRAGWMLLSGVSVREPDGPRAAGLDRRRRSEADAVPALRLDAAPALDPDRDLMEPLP
jgi:ubiquinone/menaquinone biosynthesis C-methylase UbiE